MPESPPRLTTRALRDRLDDADLTLLDVRPIDAYNGWRLRGEARGGHVVGARTLPAKWAGYLDWVEIVAAKGIDPERPVVVYGYEGAEAGEVAALLGRAGYGDVSIYEGFSGEWSADPALPMDRLARHSQLVPPTWLEARLAGRTPAEHPGGPLVVCHAHYQNPADYEAGHIPGAVALDTNTLESAETWNRRSPAELDAALTRLGITRESTVVLYGRFASPSYDDPFPGSSAGHLGAFRCAFILLYAGVKDVRMLNGGLQAWQDAGLPVTRTPTEPRPAQAFGAAIPGRPELAVDLAEARRMLADPEANLVSVRSWPEYIGEVSGYHYIEKTGRIPGSVFGNCGTDAYHMENYRNLDHTSREFHEIEAGWRAIGVTADRHNAFYCGTGWRGSEAFFNAWLLGWPRVSVYDGGWFEWSGDPANPIATGIPEAPAR